MNKGEYILLNDLLLVLVEACYVEKCLERTPTASVHHQHEKYTSKQIK